MTRIFISSPLAGEKQIIIDTDETIDALLSRTSNDNNMFICINHGILRHAVLNNETKDLRGTPAKYIIPKSDIKLIVET